MFIQAVSLNKSKVISLAQFAILLGVSIVAPLFHFQPLTGPIVNAALFIATVILGAQSAILIGFLPSLIALAVGTLPAPLAPMVPFIMVSNTILIVTFGHLKEKNFWAAVVTASILKFLFLFSTSYIVVQLATQPKIASKIAIMMSWPQLLTALAGGIIAWLLLKKFSKI